MSRLAFVLTASAVIAGCAAAGPKPIAPAPRIVRVVVTRYVPIPTELRKHCPIEQKRDDTVTEAARVARARGASLDDCNAQLDRIGEIQGAEVEP